MTNDRHFKAWLRLVGRYDWTPERRSDSAVRAFAALQRAVAKCQPGSAAGTAALPAGSSRAETMASPPEV